MNKFGQQMKLCVGCSIVQPLEEDFYKAGAVSYQKLCKMCYNDKRKKNWKATYVPKPTGFKKLPEDLQEKISYDFSVRINSKDICKKYQHLWPLKHQQLNLWRRKGQIPIFVHQQE